MVVGSDCSDVSVTCFWDKTPFYVLPRDKDEKPLSGRKANSVIVRIQFRLRSERPSGTPIFT